MLRLFYSIGLKWLGWTFIGTAPRELDKFIIVVGPHTANSDFFLGIAARSVLRLKTRYLGKSELFRFPFGLIFRMLGGYPVDRGKHNNLVDAVVDIFNSLDKFSIALAPEGTRSKVDKIKTGFYHIATKANIPIVLVGFDYGTKSIILKAPFYPTGNITNDFRMIIDFFSNMKGKIPEKGLTSEVFDNMKLVLE